MSTSTVTKTDGPKDGYATAALWERHRTQICDLYKQYPLRTVIQCMESQHGFRATPRMYKKRLSDWGLSKYAKRSIWKETAKSPAQGSQRSRSGSDVPTQSVSCQCEALRGSPCSSGCSENPKSPPRTTQTRRKLRPLASAASKQDSVPVSINRPGDVLDLEQSVVLARECIQTSFSGKRWVVTTDKVFVYAHNLWTQHHTGRVEAEASIALYEGISKACALFSQGTIEQNRQAVRHLETATEGIEGLVRIGSTFLFVELSRACLILCQWENRPGIARMLLKAFGGFFEIFKGVDHPLTQLCLRLPCFDDIALADALRRTWVVANDTYQDYLYRLQYAFTQATTSTSPDTVYGSSSPIVERFQQDTDSDTITNHLGQKVKHEPINPNEHQTSTGGFINLQTAIDRAIRQNDQDLRMAWPRQLLRSLTTRDRAWEMGDHLALGRSAQNLYKFVNELPGFPTNIAEGDWSKYERLTLLEAFQQMEIG